MSGVQCNGGRVGEELVVYFCDGGLDEFVEDMVCIVSCQLCSI